MFASDTPAGKPRLEIVETALARQVRDPGRAADLAVDRYERATRGTIRLRLHPRDLAWVRIHRPNLIGRCDEIELSDF